MSRATEFIAAKAEKRRLEISLKQLRATAKVFPDSQSEGNQDIVGKIAATNHLLTEHKKTLEANFKVELTEERLARIRANNSRPDQRYTNVSSAQQKCLFDQLAHQSGRTDSPINKQNTSTAFEASGLSPGQTVKIWNKAVTIMAGASRSQVKVKNFGNGIVFESLDRYDAIAEADHKAIAAALAVLDTPAPAPAPEPVAPTLDL